MAAGAVGIAFGAAVGMALAGIIAGILFNRILGAFIEGSISGLHCVIIGGLFIGLVCCIVISPLSRVALTSAILIICLFIAMPLWRSHADKVDTKTFYDDRMNQYREAIQKDPRNLAARERLAETFYKLGRLDEAIAEYTELVRIAPNASQEAYKLRLLIEEKAQHQSPPVTCPNCGHANPSQRRTCEQCESSLSVSTELVRWLLAGGLRQVVISTSIGVAAITLVGIILSVLAVPGRIALIAFTGFVLLSAELIHIIRQS